MPATLACTALWSLFTDTLWPGNIFSKPFLTIFATWVDCRSTRLGFAVPARARSAHSRSSCFPLEVMISGRSVG